MITIRTWSMCSVLIAGFALLAVPVQPGVHAQDNQYAVESSNELSGTSYNAPACTLYGRPCSPGINLCCPGLSCVFHGGSTRVGYVCMPRKGAARSSWELIENNLDLKELDEFLQ
jgi:hypothetical protein